MQTTAFLAGSRARVTPCATISASHRIGAPRASAPRARSDQSRREFDALGRGDLAASMDHAHGDLGFFRAEPRQIGLGADDGEGALIDGGAVAKIIEVLKH